MSNQSQPRPASTGLPLAGITVLDFTEGMAGPSCAQHLGDFGADVIKIQSTGVAANDRFLAGPTRFGPGGAFGAIEAGVHRNKQRLLLNLKDPAGLEIAYKLIASADVLIESNRPGAAERLGIGYDDVAKVRPEIVYASLSGFGQTGPLRQRRGTDQVLQAYAGPMSVTGEAGRPSSRIGPSTVDLLAGAHLTIGILLALREREQDSTGHGQWVDSSLYDATVAMMSRDIAQYTGSGELPAKFGPYFPYQAPYGCYFAADAEFFIGVSDTTVWRRFCDLAGLDELRADERFATAQDRLLNRDQLHDVLIPLFAEKEAEYWLDLAEKSGALSSRVNSVADIIGQEQAQARDMVVDIGIDGLKTAGIAIKLSKTPGTVRSQPRIPGADTDEILSGIGYDADAIAGLRDQKVVG
jgi:crotonobetainyl-CoA:carnitine CoA-transferase CaiB-like acyl-CoA transferase